MYKLHDRIGGTDPTLGGGIILQPREKGGFSPRLYLPGWRDKNEYRPSVDVKMSHEAIKSLVAAAGGNTDIVCRGEIQFKEVLDKATYKNSSLSVVTSESTFQMPEPAYSILKSQTTVRIVNFEQELSFYRIQYGGATIAEVELKDGGIKVRRGFFHKKEEVIQEISRCKFLFGMYPGMSQDILYQRIVTFTNVLNQNQWWDELGIDPTEILIALEDRTTTVIESAE